MSKRAERVIRKSLEAGERHLWSDQPRQGFAFTKWDIFLIPFSLMWGGFSFSWTYAVLTKLQLEEAPPGVWPMFPIIGIVFSIIGAYLIFGRFIADRFHRSKLAYGLTDQRALIVSTAPWGTTTSLDLNTLKDLRNVERKNGSGTIYLQESASMSPFGATGITAWHASLGQPSMFFQIKDSKHVMRIIREQMARKS